MAAQYLLKNYGTHAKISTLMPPCTPTYLIYAQFWGIKVSSSNALVENRLIETNRFTSLTKNVAITGKLHVKNKHI